MTDESPDTIDVDEVADRTAMIREYIKERGDKAVSKHKILNDLGIDRSQFTVRTQPSMFDFDFDEITHVRQYGNTYYYTEFATTKAVMWLLFAFGLLFTVVLTAIEYGYI